jgi:hypothetical protein
MKNIFIINIFANWPHVICDGPKFASNFWIGTKILVLRLCDQGCQIFLDTGYQNRGKDTKLPLNYQIAKNIPNGRNKIQRIYQPFPFQGAQTFTQIGIFGLKINHLATLLVTAIQKKYRCFFQQTFCSSFSVKRFLCTYVQKSCMHPFLLFNVHNRSVANSRSSIFLKFYKLWGRFIELKTLST